MADHDQIEESVEEESPNPPPKKKKKGKGLLIAILVTLLILGGTVGAIFTGLIKIPGLKVPGLKAKSVTNSYTDSDNKPLKVETKEPKKPQVKITPDPTPLPTKAEPETDPKLGDKKLAGIWNNMETSAIIKIAANYKDAELAAVLSNMDAEKVGEILADLPDAKRAARISQQIQAIASVIQDSESQ
jgi:hypothetical protein